MSAKTDWFPYKIPPTPSDPPISPNATYALGLSGYNPEKNPSQFLEWKQIDLTAILQRLQAIENRLNNASINASCAGGNVNVTLNL